jgi:DUF971 family protein
VPLVRCEQLLAARWRIAVLGLKRPSAVGSWRWRCIEACVFHARRVACSLGATLIQPNDPPPDCIRADMPQPPPTPQSVTLHQGSRVLEIGFSDGQSFRLPFELLRVYSPSAEVQGHGPGQEVLQSGKREVQISDLTMVGHYAIQPTFSDGHTSGIFSWSYLYELGSRQQEYWDRYLARLHEAGVDRDAAMAAAAGAGCGHHH